MSTIVHCPSCDRQLRVPEDLMGKLVKCPGCGGTFTAAEREPEPPPLPAAAAEPPAGPAPAEEIEAGERPPSRRPRPAPVADYDEDEERPRRLRRDDLTPHRGTLILVFGILGIVVCNFLGPVAWIMGNSDLREIREGRMDPEGEQLTNAGRICGIIGTVFLVLGCCAVTAYMSIAFMVIAGQGGRGF